MSLFEKLTQDMKAAMKAGEKDRLSTIRLLRGAIKDKAIDKRQDLTEEEELAVLTSAAKRRKESIQAYKEAGREDLVTKETSELEVIQTYLPQPLSQQELETIVQTAIAETGATSMKEMGAVMSAVMKVVKGRADGKEINAMVREKLSV
jgi:uncharacterized protein YqeY